MQPEDCWDSRRDTPSVLEGMATFAEKMEPQTGCLLRACNGAAVKGGRKEGRRAWFPHDSSQLVQHQVSASEEHWHMTSATTYLWPLSFNAVINLLILSLFDWFLGLLLSPCRHNMWILIWMASVAARSSGSFCENRDLWNVSTIGRASNGRIIAWLSRPAVPS